VTIQIEQKIGDALIAVCRVQARCLPDDPNEALRRGGVLEVAKTVFLVTEWVRVALDNQELEETSESVDVARLFAGLTSESFGRCVDQ
jgi:hypothetical protein